MEEGSRKVLLRLQNQCARREYCRADVLKKALKALDNDESEAAEVVASLVADRFVDDVRYASAFVREKSAISGWGPVKIRYMLAAKGISRSDVDAAFLDIDKDGADSRMEKVISHKAASLAGDPQAKLKLLRFALSRGYGYEDVREVVDRCLEAHRETSSKTAGERVD